MVEEKVGNLLGLAVLALLRERPMHPYEISSLMRERGLSSSIKLNYGSLYAVIEGLRTSELIRVKMTEREGNHPERTIYEVTEAGVAVLLERLRYLVGTPLKEYPHFVAGLTFLAQLRPQEASNLLGDRARSLESDALKLEGIIKELQETGIDRLFLIERDYQLAMQRAELEWVRTFMEGISKGEHTVEASGGLAWTALSSVQ